MCINGRFSYVPCYSGHVIKYHVIAVIFRAFPYSHVAQVEAVDMPHVESPGGKFSEHMELRIVAYGFGHILKTVFPYVAGNRKSETKEDETSLVRSYYLEISDKCSKSHLIPLIISGVRYILYKCRNRSIYIS